MNCQSQQTFLSNLSFVIYGIIQHCIKKAATLMNVIILIIITARPELSIH